MAFLRTPVSAALLLVLVALTCPAKAQVETPALCPERVDPAWVGYPTNIIPYDDGDRSGRFLVVQLWDRNHVAYGPRTSVTYVTLPDVPWDVDNPKKEWRSAAIDADCFYLTVYPQTWWVVQERYKYGIIYVPSDCEEGGDAETDHQAYEQGTYDPYQDGGVCAGGGEGNGGDTGSEGTELIPIPGAGGGGGALCGGSQNLYYDLVCIEIWDANAGAWVEWWCGIAAFCA